MSKRSHDYQTVRTLPALPDRPADGHKGMFGRLLIVGGSGTMIGAPAFSALAALRMGIGLVQLAANHQILPACLMLVPEAIGLALTNAAKDKVFQDAAHKADAIAIGPGMGQSDLARRRLLDVIRLDKPMVIDADALNLLAAEQSWPRQFAARAVLTPHPGEMKRLGTLFGVSDIPTDTPGRIDVAQKAARTLGQVIVLKGSRTVVTDGDRVYINSTGDSTLSKAGAGDVLTGVVGTLLAQGMPAFEAAVAAAWLHGRAGELAGETLGRRSALARDVIDALPGAISAFERRAKR